MNSDQTNTGIRLGVLSIVLNCLLFFLKAGIGLWSHSVSIISDAFHTLSDVLTSVLVVISFKISSKPSDEDHPFGHGQAEPIIAIIMATLLGVTGFELIKEGAIRIFHPTAPIFHWITIFVLIFSMVAKEWLARYTEKVSDDLSSDTLKADAWHHRTDAISTGLVIVAVIGARYGLFFLDGLVGLLIGFYILYIAYIISKNPMHQMMGAPAPVQVIQGVRALAREEPQILDVHDIVYHTYGSSQILSLHIELDSDLSLTEAHRIADRFSRKIREALNLFVTVHMDPVSKNSAVYLQVRSLLTDFCRQHQTCLNFHGLDISESDHGKSATLDLHIGRQINDHLSGEIIQDIKSVILTTVPQIRYVEVRIDPLFTHHQ